MITAQPKILPTLGEVAAKPSEGAKGASLADRCRISTDTRICHQGFCGLAQEGMNPIRRDLRQGTHDEPPLVGAGVR